MKRPISLDETEDDEDKKIKLDQENPNDEQSKRLGELIRTKKKLSMVG